MVDKKKYQTRKNKKKSLIRLFIGIVAIFLINLIVSQVYLRFDLTQEKRYTLSDATIQMLKELDDYAYFKVYLEGDFPAGFKRLRNETQDMLEEFKAHSHYIEYTFINPTGIADNKKRETLIQELVKKGLQPTNLHVNKKDGNSQILIFPGIILEYKGYEIPIELLNTQMGVSPERILNNSVETLEFNLASALLKIQDNKKPTVAFLDGHGELKGAYVADIVKSLNEFYILGSLRIDGRMSSVFAVDTITQKVLDKPIIDALIIAQPTKAFSESDKYVIDQYIMHGGKVFWLIDPVIANMDSLKNSSQTVALKNELNLDDQLFKYGVRLNSNLLLDLNSRSIPIVTGMIGKQAQQELLPWLYFPVLMPQSQHPIVRNLNSIMTEFPSTLDTVAVNNVKKTILLKSSLYSRLVATPAVIDLALLEEQPDAANYQAPPQDVVVLLDGRFKSLFANRITPALKDKFSLPPRKNESEKTSMLVSADGDIIKNQIHYNQHYPLPLGFDQFTRRTYGNKDFIINAMNYLCQDNGLINIRSREITLRLLDKNKVEKNKILIQIFNVFTPLILMLFLGLILTYIKKVRYTVK
ncbi:MAG: gliding motility-associated ABC transporter substrate-binding protein GldG [Bacteroidales bacterium]|nr:gliding motility-associated ABC transporter substrate-binding protein GldG [Bacteroidales bacterium]